jgi:hypothetical protein
MTIAIRPAVPDDAEFLGWAIFTAARGLEAARDAGFKRAQISFLIGNEPAEHAYRKAGFSFAEDKCAAEFEAAIGVPGLRRLARDI